jgi:hypothetical protein
MPSVSESNKGEKSKSARLTYYIFEGVLAGNADGKFFHIFALSGGGGGSKSTKKGWVKNDVVNNPYMTGLVTKGSHDDPKHVHGGPIPRGGYIIAKPAWNKDLGLSAKLTPMPGNKMAGRTGGFYIHGRGPHGSDGCIVPTNAQEFHNLMQALENEGGGSLYVLTTTTGMEFA